MVLHKDSAWLLRDSRFSGVDGRRSVRATLAVATGSSTLSNTTPVERPTKSVALSLKCSNPLQNIDAKGCFMASASRELFDPSRSYSFDSWCGRRYPPELQAVFGGQAISCPLATVCVGALFLFTQASGRSPVPFFIFSTECFPVDCLTWPCCADSRCVLCLFLLRYPVSLGIIHKHNTPRPRAPYKTFLPYDPAIICSVSSNINNGNDVYYDSWKVHPMQISCSVMSRKRLIHRCRPNARCPHSLCIRFNRGYSGLPAPRGGEQVLLGIFPSR